jgi:hypothetical protein
MRNFVQYHNSEKMGYSASKLPEPKMHTDKSVGSLSSNRVWLLSGEGKSPKTFYLAAVFKVNRVSSGTYDHPKFKNSAYGVGHIIGEKIVLNGLLWFEALKSNMNNFRNGLSEITDRTIIAELENESAPYTL